MAKPWVLGWSSSFCWHVGFWRWLPSPPKHPSHWSRNQPILWDTWWISMDFPSLYMIYVRYFTGKHHATHTTGSSLHPKRKEFGDALGGLIDILSVGKLTPHHLGWLSLLMRLCLGPVEGWKHQQHILILRVWTKFHSSRAIFLQLHSCILDFLGVNSVNPTFLEDLFRFTLQTSVAPSVWGSVLPRCGPRLELTWGGFMLSWRATRQGAEAATGADIEISWYKKNPRF